MIDKAKGDQALGDEDSVNTADGARDAAKALRRKLYLEAKRARDADPEYQAAVAAQKQQRREAYLEDKARKQAETLAARARLRRAQAEAKQAERQAKFAALQALVMPASKLEAKTPARKRSKGEEA